MNDAITDLRKEMHMHQAIEYSHLKETAIDLILYTSNRAIINNLNDLTW